MKKIFLFLFVQFIATSIFAQIDCDDKITTVSNIELSVNKVGVIGNSFGGSYDQCNYSSCEFPKGSGIEHLFDGGLWLGCKLNNNIVAVTTGAVDDASGYSTGKGGFEFTNNDPNFQITEKSSLVDNTKYNPSAISHQDFSMDFTDKNTIVPGTSIQIVGHDNPLNADIHMETYNWNYSFANFFVVLDYEITNNGTDTWDDMYIGFWKDGVIRNVNITPPGGTAFFNKGGNGFVDTLTMDYEFDAAGDIGYTDSYIGLKFLGAEDQYGFHHPRLDTNFKNHYNSWQYKNSADPLYFYPTNDQQRYDKMTNGLNHRSDWTTAIQPSLKTPNNRSSLMAVGPFNQVKPGETIKIAFALVTAKKKDDGNPTSADTDEQKSNLETNSFWAQTAYNGEDKNFNGILDAGEDVDGDGLLTRYILPAPPNTPKIKVVPSTNKVDVYWSNNSESSVDPISKKQDWEGYKIYKSKFAFDQEKSIDIFNSFELISSYDKTGNKLFFDNGFDDVALGHYEYSNGGADSTFIFEPVTFEDDPIQYYYKYTFENIQNGWQHIIAVTAFDEGDEVNNLESLESSQLANMLRVFPGTAANNDFENGDPFVYPNPYYSKAAWEGTSSFDEDKKIVFANLPTNCEVSIYTVAGDLVDSFIHNSSYNGNDIKWTETFSDPDQTQYSGGEHAWDLLSKDNQLIARGIYIFAVKDLDSGKVKKGKFIVVK